MTEDSSVDDLTQELLTLRIRLATVEAELTRAKQREQHERNDEWTFAVGERVRITNRVKRPASYLDNWDDDARQRERLATVTNTVVAKEKTPTQVWLVTDNGTRTWRAPKHLVRIPTERTISMTRTPAIKRL